jgi:hypothetical protein
MVVGATLYRNNEHNLHFQAHYAPPEGFSLLANLRLSTEQTEHFRALSCELRDIGLDWSRL